MREFDEKKPVAVLVADLHLSLKPPLARSVEDDWLEVQKGYLDQLGKLAKDIPILCAGDIFDRWNAAPELVNFALAHLPHGMFCVPGNHDLPLHSYEDIEKSAYMTLVRAHKIQNLKPGVPVTTFNDLILHGFPHGFEITPCTKGQPLRGLNIAVIHQFIWIKDHGYEGAPEEQRAKHYKEKLQGYDIAVFGDNHDPFQIGKSWNCGGFQRRRRDEINHKPRVGVLYGDGHVEERLLDTSRDKFASLEELKAVARQFDFVDLIEELYNLGENSLDFVEALVHFMEDNKVAKHIRKLVLQAVENE